MTRVAPSSRGITTFDADHGLPPLVTPDAKPVSELVPFATKEVTSAANTHISYPNIEEVVGQQGLVS